MSQRILVHLHRAFKQTRLVQPIRHFRFAYGGDGALQEISLLAISASSPNFCKFRVRSHAVSRTLFPIRRVDRDRFSGCCFRFLEFALRSEPMRFPDQWALLEGVSGKKLVQTGHAIRWLELQ